MKAFVLLLFLIVVARPRNLDAQVRINSGGDQIGAAPSPVQYSADSYFSGGTPYTSPIALPAGASPMYQTERFGNFSYTVPLPAGAYSVTLHFIENSTAITAANQRVFSVAINGQPVLVNLDLFAAAGFNVPFSRTFVAYAVGANPAVKIAFTTVIRNAVISGIDIDPAVPATASSFPGCESDAAEGIRCKGSIQSGAGDPHSGSIAMGGSVSGYFILAAPDVTTGDSAGRVVVLVAPARWDDAGGGTLKDSGVVKCPKLPDVLAKMNPVCHQAQWLKP